jgi:hypothetical protein
VEESFAVVTYQSGWQGDHGWAVAFKQGPRRCLLLDTTDGLSDEEVFWTAMAAWAQFQPRLSTPRVFPGRLFYPDEVSHVIQDCWTSLEDMSSSPGFSDKSPICRAAMLAFSEGLSRMDTLNWAPQPAAEAIGKFGKTASIAEIAAHSRLRPIADGPNQWEMHRSSAATVGGIPLPWSVQSQAPAPG